ncbi:hypothetical protein HMPREF0476_0786 [Kingella kingae ATCC 23330]|uniref:Uncharacterized protein n=1 Tax=Kingella kingae ATCC 23330 TaxID=887327 RepID=F5S6F3_KINKI|nr:hypothetical protein HMPREF0476_0786 [Kingella kingae ATCC 23330]
MNTYIKKSDNNDRKINEINQHKSRSLMLFNFKLMQLFIF